MPRPIKMTSPAIVSARLAGIAGRHAVKNTDEAEAVAELRQVAAGRTDLLTEVAGAALGGADMRGWPERDRRIAELCIAAGADEALIPGIAAAVRARLARPRYSSHG